MRKALLSLFLVSVFAISSLGMQAGISITKIVNGDWEVSIPVNLDLVDNTTGARSYLLTKVVYTAPRINLKALNHSRIEATFGGGIRGTRLSADADTTAAYWWAGNNEGIPEGIRWKNSFNVYAGERYY